MRSAAVVVLVLGLTLGVAEAQQKAEATSPAIQKGSKVELEYTLTNDGGQVLDSNKGRTPLTFTLARLSLLGGSWCPKSLEMGRSVTKVFTTRAVAGHLPGPQFRRRLSGQLEAELDQEHLLSLVGLCVPGHVEPAPVRGRDADV
jgi:hypothetical protein